MSKKELKKFDDSFAKGVKELETVTGIEQPRAYNDNLPPYGHSIGQSNALTNSRRPYDVVEQRCLYLIIDTIRNKRKKGAYIHENLFYDNLIISMETSYLAKATDEKKVRRAFDSLKKLRDKGMEIESEDEILYVSPINYATYDKKRKVYEIEVSKKLIPYLIGLSDKFTAYQLSVAMILKSKYSQRLYEICSEYKNMASGRFFLDISKLRGMLNIENEYKLYSGFKKNVLDKARDEIKALFDDNRSDIWFNYYEDETTKKRKAYTRIWFQVYTRTEQEQREKELNDMFNARLWIIKFISKHIKRDPKYIKRITNAIDKNPNIIAPIYSRLYKISREDNIEDYAAITRYILREDYNLT